MEVKISHTNGMEKDCTNDLSYIHCVGKYPLIYRTIGQQLRIIAKEECNTEAFVFVEENKKITYGQLLVEADRLAAGLQCLGLKKGDRLCVLTANVPIWPIALFAAARGGFISVFINPTFSAEEIEKCLKKVSAKTLISAEKYGTTFLYDKLSEILPHCGKKLPLLSTIIIDSDKHYAGTHRLTDIMALPTFDQISNIENQQGDISPESGCNIQFTSGFTGTPKGVLINHFGLINATYHDSYRLGLCNSRMCVHVSCCHLFALWCTMIAIYTKSTVVVPSFIFDPEKSLSAIVKEKCKIVFGLSKLYIDMVSKQKELNLSIEDGLVAVIGGTPCSDELYNQIKEELKVTKFKIMFGMTEHIGPSFFTLPEDTAENLDIVGPVMDHFEVKVVDEYGKLVPFGTPGELCVRTHTRMIGYWEDEEKTKEVLGSDGWLKTGDCFILQKNGYGKALARISDIIKKGLEKIFPKEIEDILVTCPGISEAYVVGVPDENLGEELCAFVGVQNGFELTSNDLHEFCKGKLSTNKIPRYINFVENFPKTVSGKVKKRELKDQFIQDKQIN